MRLLLAVLVLTLVACCPPRTGPEPEAVSAVERFRVHLLDADVAGAMRLLPPLKPGAVDEAEALIGRYARRYAIDRDFAVVASERLNTHAVVVIQEYATDGEPQLTPVYLLNADNGWVIMPELGKPRSELVIVPASVMDDFAPLVEWFAGYESQALEASG